MDIARQCRRFLNYQVINHQHFHKKLANISALSVLKNTGKLNKETNITPITYKLIIADSEEKILMIISESDHQLIKEAKVNYATYGIGCTNKPNNNHIYVSDYTNNVVRKYDENLNEIGKLKLKDDVAPLSGPCGIVVNSELEQIQVVDQKNCRVVYFDLKTDEYLSEFKLFQDDLVEATKYLKPTSHDLSAMVKLEDFVGRVKARCELDFWPFGIYTKNER